MNQNPYAQFVEPENPYAKFVQPEEPKNPEPLRSIEDDLATVRAGGDVEPSEIPFMEEQQAELDQAIYERDVLREGERKTALKQARAKVKPSDWVGQVGAALSQAASDIVDIVPNTLNLTADVADWATNTPEDAPRYRLPRATSLIDDLSGNFFSENLPDPRKPVIPRGVYGSADKLYDATMIAGGAAINAPAAILNTAKRNIATIASNSLNNPSVLYQGAKTGTSMTGNALRASSGDLAAAGGYVAGTELGGEKVGMASALLSPTAAPLINKIGGGLQRRVAPSVATEIERAKKHLDYSSTTDNLDSVVAQKVADGEAGTMATMTGDKGIYNLEKRAQENPTASHQIDLADEALDADILNTLDSQGGVSADTFGAQGRSRLAKSKAKLRAERNAEVTTAKQAKAEGVAAQESIAKTARQQADEANVAYGNEQTANIAAEVEAINAKALAEDAKVAMNPNARPSTTSKALVEDFNTAKSDSKKAYGKKWDEFDTAVPIEAEAVKTVLKDYLAKLNLTPTQTKLMEKKYGNIMSMIKGLEGRIEPREVHTLISEIKAINANAKNALTKTTTPVNKNFSQVAKGLEKALEKVGNSGATYKEAVKMTADHHVIFSNPSLSKQLTKALPAEALDVKNMTGAKGATLIDDINILKDRVPSTDTAVQSVLREAAAGNYTPEMSQKFLRNYDEILTRYPELRTQLESLKVKQEAVVAANTKLGVSDKQVKLAKTLKQTADRTAAKETAAVPVTATRLGRTVDKAKKTAKTKLTSLEKTTIANIAREPKKALDKIFNGSTSNVASYVKQADAAYGNREAFKRAVLDRFKVSKAETTVGTSKYVGDNAFGDFSKVSDDLVGSGVFTRAEVDTVLANLGRAEYKLYRKNAKAPKNTPMPRGDKLVGSIVGFAVSRGLPVHGSLIMANAIRQYALGTIEFAGKETALSRVILNEMLANPEKYIDTSKLSTAKSVKAIERQAKDVIARIKRERNITAIAVTSAVAAKNRGEENE